MPPRIHSQIVPSSLRSSLSLSSTTCASSLSSVPQQSSRSFSSTPAAQTRLRQQMFLWLGSQGQGLKSHIPGSTNYLTDMKNREKYADGEVVSGPSRPFPSNNNFQSEPILSEDLRNDIYERVVVKKQSVRAVSVKTGVDMRRVAAVCRLVELEKRWREQVRQAFFSFLFFNSYHYDETT
ncbi:eukaryotic mitochondrial regulator protein-domain-containing protein [Aspergillus pseudoustus]|uniref:Eukaryotic mitochondrial regulator protein-domain-containing protein n=1 Tax=Aspergillus pseudoustus TaxID=1810923 RepID=A0ABR4JIM5_9EURO